MDHPAAMGTLEAVADFDSIAKDLVDWQRPIAETIGESLAFQILHHEVADAVLLSDIMEGADVGMVQRRDGSGFAVETLPGVGILGKLRRKNFDGNSAIQASVARAIDFTHAAGAYGRNDLVWS
jgi:hypothetical protein